MAGCDWREADALAPDEILDRVAALHLRMPGVAKKTEPPGVTFRPSGMVPVEPQFDPFKPDDG